MSGDDPTEGNPQNPFESLPFMGELMRIIGESGQPGADRGRQVARSIAVGGATEPNVDPAERIAVEQLLRVAELQAAEATGLPATRGGKALRVEVANRCLWSDRTVDDYAPLFAALGSSISAGLAPATESEDPMGAMLAGITQMMGPMMMALTTGSMVGQLAQRALGGYELPIPRPAAGPVLICLPNINELAAAWSLDSDDLRLWVCLNEAVHHAVFGVDHVRERLEDLLRRHAAGFEVAAHQIGDRLGGFDFTGGLDSLTELQAELNDPDAILGAVRSEAQERLQPELTALIAAITGYVDQVMDGIGGSLIGSYGRLTEALRRRRIEADSSDRLVERMLGLELDRAQYDRGAAFAAGVVERADREGLARLFSDPSHLPTPAEVDAPGLWLARIDLPR